MKSRAKLQFSPWDHSFSSLFCSVVLFFLHSCSRKCTGIKGEKRYSSSLIDDAWLMQWQQLLLYERKQKNTCKSLGPKPRLPLSLYVCLCGIFSYVSFSLVFLQPTLQRNTQAKRNCLQVKSQYQNSTFDVMTPSLVATTADFQRLIVSRVQDRKIFS